MRSVDDLEKQLSLLFEVGVIDVVNGQKADSIPVPSDHIYFKSFPEFSTLTCDIASKALATVQTIMNKVGGIM